MKLITSNEQLTALIPNVMAVVKGEAPLIDKLAPFLTSAEEWFADTFASQDYFQQICALPDVKQAKIIASRIVASEAFRQAIPNLDVILTPNGFGIVSNSNVAPASKERIDRLLTSLLDNRDAGIEQMMPILAWSDVWLMTPQAQFFRATMFPSPSVARLFPRPQGGRWEQYLAIREQAIPIECFFARQYLSTELMDIFRFETQRKDYRTPHHEKLCSLLQSVLARCLKSNDPQAQMHFEHAHLFDMVNVIRDYPDEFPEWHSSPLAELYQPEVFVNKKKSQGFWF
jgi:hypothetical protein